jgi:hypothetical protein
MALSEVRSSLSLPPSLSEKPIRLAASTEGTSLPMDCCSPSAPVGSGFHDSAALRALAVSGGALGSLGAGALAIPGPGLGIPLDKVKHAGVCFTGTLALAGMGLSPALSAGLFFASATLGKELLWDGLLGLGHCDPLDVAANLSGSLAAYSLLMALKPADDSR